MGSGSRFATKWVFEAGRASPMAPIGGTGDWIGAGACISAMPGAVGRGSAAAAGVTNGAAIRTGASAELPASPRGGLGLEATAGATFTAAGVGAEGVDALEAEALGAWVLETAWGATDGFGGTVEGVGAGIWDTVLPSGVLAAVLVTAALAMGGLAAGFLTAGCLVAVGTRAGLRLAWMAGALAGARRLVDAAGAFAAGLRTAGLAAGRLATADLAGALVAGLRRAEVAAFPATGRAATGRADRLAIGFATVLGLGRATAVLRVAVACLAGAATFFAFGVGRRTALLATLPAVGRFPDPLAGVDAFI